MSEPENWEVEFTWIGNSAPSHTSFSSWILRKYGYTPKTC